MKSRQMLSLFVPSCWGCFSLPLAWCWTFMPCFRCRCSYSGSLRCSWSQRLLLSSAWPACRSEEHTSELQSLMRISYAVFCLKKKKKNNINNKRTHDHMNNNNHYITTDNHIH